MGFQVLTFTANVVYSPSALHPLLCPVLALRRFNVSTFDRSPERSAWDAIVSYSPNPVCLTQAEIQLGRYVLGTGTDLIGCINYAKYFVVAGKASEKLLGVAGTDCIPRLGGTRSLHLISLVDLPHSHFPLPQILVISDSTIPISARKCAGALCMGDRRLRGCVGDATSSQRCIFDTLDSSPHSPRPPRLIECDWTAGYRREISDKDFDKVAGAAEKCS